MKPKLFLLLPLLIGGAAESKIAKPFSEIPFSSYPSSVLGSVISSSEEQVTSNSDSSVTPNLVTYFQNLTAYSPYNAQGSCGYVSLIQYLSFYDTFYNDSIIPEQFEQSQGETSNWSQAVAVSPGVLRQKYPQPYSDNNKNTDFYDFVQANKDSDYQMYLMSLYNDSLNRNAESYSCGIAMDSYYRIISQISAFDQTSFEYAFAKNVGNDCKDETAIAWFDSYVKDLLDQNKPVILHIKTFSKETDKLLSYHSIVAYYYDQDGIHTNYGWGAADADRVIADTYSEYTRIEAAGAIDFTSVSKKHSNNYNIGGAYYCGCTHHDHDYTSSFASYSSKYHKAFCACGEYALRSHAILSGSTYIRNGRTYGVCTDCNGTINLGENKGLVHDGLPTKISDNGSYIRPDGIIVLVEEDIDSYKDGTLIFYDAESKGELS